MNQLLHAAHTTKCCSSPIAPKKMPTGAGVPVQATLPLRLGMTFTAGRCDPQTSAGIVVNETATGCGNPADNAALAPQSASSI